MAESVTLPEPISSEVNQAHAVQTSKNISRPKTAKAPSGGVKVSRRYTQKGVDALSAIKYEKRVSKITEPDGRVVFEMNNVEVPVTWSQLATDIIAQKYFRKAGVHGGGETSARQVVYRVAHTIREFGEAKGYFASKEDADTFEQELLHLCITQKGAFNSPVWFNCGLAMYGIQGDRGNYAWDFEKSQITEIMDAYSRPQCSACFIQKVEDSLMGIFELAKNEAKLFKYGSGTGSNFSKLRSKYENLSGGGISSGLMSFLEVLDKGAGAIKSGGTTRRAAKMVTLDIDHPEIREFINWKVESEKKAKALIDAGYDGDWRGEAYKTVSGQNSNNSVRVSDEFMNQVEKGGKFWTKFRSTGEKFQEMDAQELFEEICKAAWSCADPGLQFDDTINNWHTSPNSGRINGSNPCSEYMFLDDTACNLASINLVKFLRKDGSFDIEGYRHACRIFFMAQEILVDLSSYPTESIAKNSHDFRPLGLGYANLGTLLMMMSVPYDSDKGRNIAAALTAIMHLHAFSVSAEMAKVIGPFASYEKNREPMLKVMSMHRDEAYKIDKTFCPSDLYEAACEDGELALEMGEKYGYRNAQATVLAPTGTIGLLMDCDTTGIEPEFSMVKWKKLAGGGHFKIINKSIDEGLHRLGYSDSEIKDIIEYILGNAEKQGTETIEGAPHLKEEHLAIFDCANKCGNGSRFIKPLGHVKMMGATQPFLSGAISKTVNMPNESTIQDIRDIYFESWRLGLKAIAIYRDGSKHSQPLSNKSDTKKTPEAYVYPDGTILRGTRKALPAKRRGITVETSVAGQKLFVRTGEYDEGALGEIFIDSFKEGASYRSLLNCFAVAVSIGLQYGVPLEKYVDKFTFTRFDPSGFTNHPNIRTCTSIVDFIFRVLGMEYLGRTDFVHVAPTTTQKDENSVSEKVKEAIQNEAKGSESLAPVVERSESNENLMEQSLGKMMGDAPACTTCGHITVRNASCYKCLNCGASMGCS